MLFDDKLLFIHAPKTAGTSVTSFLIANSPNRVTLTEPSAGPDPAVAMPAFARTMLALRRLRWCVGMLMRNSVTLVEGSRHENLRQASEVLAKLGRKLEDFRAIVSIVRNPYDLEVSRYHFFRRGYHGVKGVAHEYAEELALAGDFEAFARKAPYHGRLPAQIEDWYEIDGNMPNNLRIVRFENLEKDLHEVVAQLYPVRTRLPKLNASEHAPYKSYLTADSEDAIYNKYRWLFDRNFYRREAD